MQVRLQLSVLHDLSKCEAPLDSAYVWARDNTLDLLDNYLFSFAQSYTIPILNDKDEPVLHTKGKLKGTPRTYERWFDVDKSNSKITNKIVTQEQSCKFTLKVDSSIEDLESFIVQMLTDSELGAVAAQLYIDDELRDEYFFKEEQDGDNTVE